MNRTQKVTCNPDLESLHPRGDFKEEENLLSRHGIFMFKCAKKSENVGHEDGNFCAIDSVLFHFNLRPNHPTSHLLLHPFSPVFVTAK